MINRQALVFVATAAATVRRADAFAPSSPYAIQQRQCRTISLHVNVGGTVEAKSREDDVELTRKVIMNHVDTPSEQELAEPITDTPPMPAVVEPVATEVPTPAAAKTTPKKKKKMGNPHKAGVFSPIVVAGKAVLGQDSLIKIRAKIIGLHSDLIKSFVATADSDTGKAVLRQLFKIVDADDSGYLDKEEVMVALNLLGFKWLGEKEVDKIFARADKNGDLEISLEEFMVETPKTLKLNLVKLAKLNGGEMGLLV